MAGKPHGCKPGRLLLHSHGNPSALSIPTLDTSFLAFQATSSFAHRQSVYSSFKKKLAEAEGFEPSTAWLTVTCSSNWAMLPCVCLSRLSARSVVVAPCPGALCLSRESNVCLSRLSRFFDFYGVTLKRSASLPWFAGEDLHLAWLSAPSFSVHWSLRALTFPSSRCVSIAT